MSGAGSAASWTPCPSACGFGRVGSPPLSLLRLGVSCWLGFGTKSASQVGGALASLCEPLLLSECSGPMERKPRLPAQSALLLSPAAARARLSGLFGRSWGLEPSRRGVRLLGSAGPPPPASLCLASPTSSHLIPSEDAPRFSRSAFSPRTRLPQGHTESARGGNRTACFSPYLVGPSPTSASADGSLLQISMPSPQPLLPFCPSFSSHLLLSSAVP